MSYRNCYDPLDVFKGARSAPGVAWPPLHGSAARLLRRLEARPCARQMAGRLGES